MGNVVPSGGKGGVVPDLHVYLQEFPQLVFSAPLKQGKLLKSALCKSGEHGDAVIKVYRKPPPGALGPVDLEAQLRTVYERLVLIREHLTLYEEPNLLPYQMFKNSAKSSAGFLLRQYICNNLTDRLSTYPGLTAVEKRWLIYQLLAALEQAHSKGICHGDIKSENVLVTSWNWLLLADFGPYKPVRLPAANDVAVLYYFFEPHKGRAACNIAPERFVNEPSDRRSTLSSIPSRPSLSSGTPVAPAEAATMKLPIALTSVSVSNTELDTLLDDATTAGLPPGTPGDGKLLKPQGLATPDGRRRESSAQDMSPFAARISALKGADFAPSGRSNSDERPKRRASNAAMRHGSSLINESGVMMKPLCRGTDKDGNTIFPCDSELTEAMDVFSAGCVIAEVFLDGDPLFDQSQLLQYRAAGEARRVAKVKGGNVTDYEPPALAKIADPFVQELVRHMIQHDPVDRCSAAQYILAHEHEDGLFPPYFSVLFGFLAELVLPAFATADAKVRHIAVSYGSLLRDTMDICDPVGEEYFRRRCASVHLAMDADHDGDATMDVEDDRMWEWSWEWGHHSLTPLSLPSLLSLYSPWTMHRMVDSGAGGSVASFSHAVSPSPVPSHPAPSGPARLQDLLARAEEVIGKLESESPTSLEELGISGEHVTVEFLPQQPDSSFVPVTDPATVDRGAFVILIGVLSAQVRHVSTPQLRVTAIALLARMATHVDDETRLQKVVPFLVAVLSDKSSQVRAHALCALTHTLCRVTAFPQSDALLFPTYILPAVSKLQFDPDMIVQLAFAECLPLLAHASRRFMETSHWRRMLDDMLVSAKAAAAMRVENASVVAGLSSTDTGASESKSSEGLTTKPKQAAFHWSLDESKLAMSAAYDKMLESLHGKVEQMFQKWLMTLTTGVIGPSGAESGGFNSMYGFLRDSGFSRETLTRLQAVAVCTDVAKLPASSDLALIKRTLFRGLTRLCLFFGRTSTESSLLPALFAFLNDDRDWQLKQDFSAHVIGLCAYVGQSSVRKFVLPPLEDGAHSSQHPVARASLSAITTLVRLNLLPVSDLPEVCGKFLGLVCHPSPAIRDAVFQLTSACMLRVGWPDALVVLGSSLKPVFRDPKPTSKLTGRLYATIAAQSTALAQSACTSAPASLDAQLLPYLIPSWKPGVALGSEIVLPEAAVSAVAVAFSAAVLPPLHQRLFDKAVCDCMQFRRGTIAAPKPTLSSLLPLTLAQREEFLQCCTPLTTGISRPGLDTSEKLTEYQLALLWTHIEATGSKFKFTVMDQVRLRERVSQFKQFTTPRQHNSLLKHAGPALPYPKEVIAALPVHSVSIPDQRFVTQHPAPPSVVLEPTLTVKMKPRSRRPAHRGITRTKRTPTVTSRGKNSSTLRSKSASVVGRSRRTSSTNRRLDSDTSDEGTSHGEDDERSKHAGGKQLRKQWMKDAGDMWRQSRAHWTRDIARSRRQAGRRARRVMLKYGLWDPRVPLPTDPSAVGFYYPTDGGVDDPTLLSSDDEAERASKALTKAAKSPIREEASVADDASEFVMAEGTEVLLMTPKVVRTPLKAATAYANALATALSLGASVGFISEPQGTTVQRLVDRFHVHSQYAPRRVKPGQARGDKTTAQRKAGPTPSSGAITVVPPSVDVLDSSYVRTTLPEGVWHGGTLPMDRDSALFEAMPVPDESLMSSPVGAGRAAVIARSPDATVTQTGYESSVHVDSLLPRRLAALKRRLNALSAPPLPPELGKLQRSGQKPGSICAHALRVASGAVHSDSDSDGEEVVQRESVAVELALGLIDSHTPVPLLATNGLLELTPRGRELSTIARLDGTASEADDVVSDAKPAFVPQVIRRVGASGSIADATDKPQRSDLDDSFHLGYSPDVGDGTGYKGNGVGSFLVARKGWASQGMGLVNAAVPSQLVAELEDSGTWGSRPRGMLLATCKPHAGPVTDLTTSQDHSFFVSGSSDATVAVWLTKNLNKSGYVKPEMVYSKQDGRITSLAMIDNTTSVACGATNGSVHVLRIDVSEGSASGSLAGSNLGLNSSFMTSGTAARRAPVVAATIDVSIEGAVQAVRHFNDAYHSPLLFATSGGGLHSYDLRARRAAWRIPIPYPLGFVTAMEIVPGGLAVVIGTNRGVIAVYDTRFRLLVSAWRHSARTPIHSLFPYPTFVQTVDGTTQKQLACVVATGENESAVWNLETGACLALLRNLPTKVSESAARRPPFLTRIPTRGNAVAKPAEHVIRSALSHALDELGSSAAQLPSMRALLCPMPTTSDPSWGVGYVLGGMRGSGTRLKGGAAGPSGHDPLNGLPSWMLTSGTTGLVQCWDFDTPVASYTVCGLDPGETRHVYQSVECLPYTTASTTGGSHSVAGGIRAAERTAAGTLDAHFVTHNTEDGLSMTHLQSHLNLDAPMAILCQQPKLVTETARGLGSSLAGLPSPAQQMKGPVPASTRHENGINSMSWIDASYGRLLVTGGRDGVVKLWR